MMHTITLVTDDDGNVLGGTLQSASAIDSGLVGESQLEPLAGQRIHHDVALTDELLAHESHEALVKELLGHRLDSEGKLSRKK